MRLTFSRSITPSVTLICDTPEDITQSFYQGKVNVTFKELVFQPSSSFCFSIELIKMLEVNGQQTAHSAFVLSNQWRSGT